MRKSTGTGLADMVGDLPTGKVDAAAVEREAAEAAEAAAQEAAAVNAQVRAAEAQVSGSVNGQPSRPLPAGELSGRPQDDA
ncbi:hypothetical protein [Actinoplanes auranticolor]|nr:hypothetical protein [Actinoplanes auranticolor]